MRAFLKNNFIFTIYCSLQIIIVFFSSFQDEIIGQQYEIDEAITYHIFSLFLFCFGYLTSNIKRNNRIVKKYTLVKSFKTFSYLCIIIGTITSIATVGSIISPQEYLNILFSGGNEVTDIKVEAGEGGLSGVLKMLNYLPLGIFLISSSYYNFLSLSNKDRADLLKIKRFSLLASIIKTLFSLDRLTILAILLVIIYEQAIVKKIKLKVFFGISILFLVLSFITASRMGETSVFQFLVIYFKLSLVNYQQVIEYFDNWTYGWSTFLVPLWYILKFFGLNREVVVPTYWVWNPAQYFNSYFYMDFGVYSILLFYFLGVIVRMLQTGVSKSKKFAISLYFIVIFAVSTFISVPFIRGIEFWLLIFLSFLSTRFIKNENNT